MTRFAAIRRVLATMLLALWWGGSTFYAGRVVFIGHEVLRSKIRQGFITERVTYELNWLGLATLCIVALEFVGALRSPRRATWIAWITTSITTVALFVLHVKLAGMLDFSVRQVADDDQFYGWHRVYLCVATIQWVAGGVLLALFHFDKWPETVSRDSPQIKPRHIADL